MDMNVLWGTRVYTMGAMQYADGQDWRNQVKQTLEPRGVTVFDPYNKPFVNEIPEHVEARQLLNQWMYDGDYDKVSERMKKVRADDLRLCDLSDFGIVQVRPTVPTWGTPEELSWFVRCKKPTFVFVEGGKENCPLWIFGQIPHHYIYDNLESVLDMLIQIDSGEKPIDNVRWHLLRKEFICPTKKI